MLLKRALRSIPDVLVRNSPYVFFSNSGADAKKVPPPTPKRKDSVGSEGIILNANAG